MLPVVKCLSLDNIKIKSCYHHKGFRARHLQIVTEPCHFKKSVWTLFQLDTTKQVPSLGWSCILSIPQRYKTDKIIIQRWCHRFQTGLYETDGNKREDLGVCKPQVIICLFTGYFSNWQIGKKPLKLLLTGFFSCLITCKHGDHDSLTCDHLMKLMLFILICFLCSLSMPHISYMGTIHFIKKHIVLVDFLIDFNSRSGLNIYVYIYFLCLRYSQI